MEQWSRVSVRALHCVHLFRSPLPSCLVALCALHACMCLVSSCRVAMCCCRSGLRSCALTLSSSKCERSTSSGFGGIGLLPDHTVGQDTTTGQDRTEQDRTTHRHDVAQPGVRGEPRRGSSSPRRTALATQPAHPPLRVSSRLTEATHPGRVVATLSLARWRVLAVGRKETRATAAVVVWSTRVHSGTMQRRIRHQSDRGRMVDHANRTCVVCRACVHVACSSWSNCNRAWGRLKAIQARLRQKHEDTRTD
jgi:hypothetical protein